MSGTFSQDKGKRAEREVVKLLQLVIDKIYGSYSVKPRLERNLMQSHQGGHDLVGIDWLALEVKHHETLAVPAWWRQTVKQAGDDKVPVLFYRQSRQKWTVMTFVALHYGDGLILWQPAEMTADAWLQYFEKRLESELPK